MIMFCLNRPLIHLLIIFSSYLVGAWAARSLDILPLEVKGDWKIYANLIDINSGEKYSIKEFIHSGPSVYGKISISTEKQSFDVYYSSSYDDRRIVMYDDECDLFDYKLRWDKKLPGVTRPLVNHMLLIGPSILFRLKHELLPWQNGNVEMIRGQTMHSAYAILPEARLNFTYYFKDTLPFDINVHQPARIAITGIDPSESTQLMIENLILDIYLLMESDENLDKHTTIKPGIGCPFALRGNLDHSITIADMQVHYISIEKVSGLKDSTTRNEVWADQENQMLSLRSTINGEVTEAIYDYTLGLIYKLDESKTCAIIPMDLSSPGLNGYTKTLSVKHLLGVNFKFKYMGKVSLKHRSDTEVDVWETVIYNGTLQSGTYNKIVYTCYVIDSTDSDTASGAIIVSSITKAYIKNSKEKYSLIETIQKDYYDFGQEISDEEHRTRFRLSDCYGSEEGRKTLLFTFKCTSQNDLCNKLSSHKYYEQRNLIKTAIVNTGLISASRILDVQLIESNNDTITYSLTFSAFPEVKRAFVSKREHVSEKTAQHILTMGAISSEECLEQNKDVTSQFDAIIFCRKRSTCTMIRNSKDIIYDKNGDQCEIYQFPLHNLHRFGQELRLDKIADVLGVKGLYLYLRDGGIAVQHQLTQVDEPRSNAQHEPLIKIVSRESKLVEDADNVLKVTDAANFGDCYRACAHSNYANCETFSYCQLNNKIECLVSPLTHFTDGVKKINSSCQIYAKDHRLDYVMVSNRKFINPGKMTFENSAISCADLCFNSDQCSAFQKCDDKCTFSVLYTDDTVEYSDQCDIYIPKVSQKYGITSGQKIVSETFHTAYNVSMDQCAALCHEWPENGEKCISFNYCPKSKSASSCGLSKYSVKSDSTKNIGADFCRNYEQIVDKNNVMTISNGRKSTSGAKTSIGTTFDLILLFVAFGLVIGSAGSFIYPRLKTIDIFSIASRATGWTRHLDVIEPEPNPI